MTKHRFTVERINDHGTVESSITYTDGEDSGAFSGLYWALENDWGFKNYLTVLIAVGICERCYTKKQRETLRQFLQVMPSLPGTGVEEIMKTYEIAIVDEE